MYFENAVTLPRLRLRALVSLLETIEKQAGEKNISIETILSARLAPDMLPLSKQIQIVSDNAKGIASRLAHQEAPKMEDTETTLEELVTRLTRTIVYLETFTEADFVDAATAEARFPYMPWVKLVGADYLFTYALPNFFFHVVTIYAILRHLGFEIGKRDYMGSEVVMVPDEQ